MGGDGGGLLLGVHRRPWAVGSHGAWGVAHKSDFAGRPIVAPGCGARKRARLGNRRCLSMRMVCCPVCIGLRGRRILTVLGVLRVYPVPRARPCTAIRMVCFSTCIGVHGRFHFSRVASGTDCRPWRSRCMRSFPHFVAPGRSAAEAVRGNSRSHALPGPSRRRRPGILWLSPIRWPPAWRQGNVWSRRTGRRPGAGRPLARPGCGIRGCRNMRGGPRSARRNGRRFPRFPGGERPGSAQYEAFSGVWLPDGP